MFSLTDLQLLAASASLLPVKGNAVSGLLGEKGPEGGAGPGPRPRVGNERSETVGERWKKRMGEEQQATL